MNDFWKNAVDMPTLRTERNIKPRVSPIGFDSAVLVDDVLNANSRALWTNGPCCFFGHGAHLNWMVNECLSGRTHSASVDGERRPLTDSRSLWHTGAASKEVECDSSKSKRKSRTRQTCGFFVPVPNLFLAGRVATRKDAHLTCFRLSTSRPPCWMRVIAHRQGHQSLSKERIMASATLGTSAQITPFNFGTHSVRVVMRDGEPWFVASDVADALGYLTAKDAARNLGEHQKGGHILPTPGGEQRVTIINDSGLYRLVLRSRKPEAEKFSDWVTGEVLPSIRKTGGYGQPQQFFTHKRWLVSFRDGREVVQEIDWNDCLLKYEDLPKLLAAPDNLVGSALLADIAAACVQRLARDIDGLSSTCSAYRKQIKEMEQPALPEGQTRRIA